MAVINNVKFANFFRTHVATDVTAVATAIPVVDTTGLPVITGDEYFYLVLNQLNTGFKEVVRVDSYAANVLTVQRGQDGTSALAFSHGDRCEQWFNAGLLRDLTDEIYTEIDKLVFPNSAAGVDQGDVLIVGSVAQLINAAAGNPLHIRLPGGGDNNGEYNAVTPLTVPSNVLLELDNGAFLSGTWTLQHCQFWAPVNKVFDGAMITFNASVREVYPQWWLANFGDDIETTDMAPAFLAAGDTRRDIRLTDDGNSNRYRILSSVSLLGGSARPKIIFEKEARFVVDNTFSVDLNGREVVAEYNQIVDGAGQVFGATAEFFRPEWTGGNQIGLGIGAADLAFDRLVNELMSNNSGTILCTNLLYNFTGDVTIPSTVRIQMDNFSELNLVSGTFTMNGEMVAASRQVFRDSGGDLEGDFSNHIPSPQWFDANLTNTAFATDPVGAVDGNIGEIYNVINTTTGVFPPPDPQARDGFYKVTNGVDGWESIMGLGIQDFADGDTTPSVNGYKNFRTANTGSTVITNLDDGYVGKRVKIFINDTNTTFDFDSAFLLGPGAGQQTFSVGTIINAVLDDANLWYCTIERTSTVVGNWDWDSGWTQLIGPETAHDLDDVGPALTAFSDITKEDASSGVTSASARLTDVITPSDDDPGYTEMIVMVKQRDDVGGGSPYTNYMIFHGSNYYNSGGSKSWTIAVVDNSIKLYTHENSFLNFKDYITADIGWTLGSLNADEALVRIKIRR
jgi:hypothetical protein